MILPHSTSAALTVMTGPASCAMCRRTPVYRCERCDPEFWSDLPPSPSYERWLRKGSPPIEPSPVLREPTQAELAL